MTAHVVLGVALLAVVPVWFLLDQPAPLKHACRIWRCDRPAVRDGMCEPCLDRLRDLRDEHARGDLDGES